MKRSLIEEFFECEAHQSESTYSLEFMSNQLIYYFEWVPSLSDVVLTVSNEKMKPSVPLFELNIICDDLVVTHSSGVESTLIFSVKGRVISSIAIKKNCDGFFVSVDL